MLFRNLDPLFNGQTVGEVTVTRSASDAQPVGPGLTIERSARFILPSTRIGSGLIEVSVLVDSTGTVNEFNRFGLAERNNAARTTVTAIAVVLPDLVVGAVTPTPSGAFAAGSTVQVAWTTTNSGQAPVNGAWRERLRVINLSNGAVVATGFLSFDTAVNPADAIAVNGVANRSLTVTWPSDISADGQFRFEVTTDVDGTIPEANAADNAEANNQNSTTVASAPDLAPSALAVAPGIIESGGSLTLTWTVTNSGTTPVRAPTGDRLSLVNVATGERLVFQSLAYSAAELAGLAPGGSIGRSTTVTLPEGLRGAGLLRAEIATDRAPFDNLLGEVLETNEGNNIAVVEVTSTLRLYADLAVTSVIAPPSATGGTIIRVDWSVENQSSVAATGDWTDRIVFSTDSILGNSDDIALGEVVRSGLGARTSYSASLDVTLPSRFDGTGRLFVRTDAGQVVNEPDTRANNTASRSIALTSPFSDLATSAVTVPGLAAWDETVRATWTVTNLGPSATDATTWTDTVYLSRDSVIDGSDLVLGQVARTAGLASGGSYQGSFDFVVGRSLLDGYRVLVRADSGGVVYQKGLVSNDTAASGLITIQRAPAADLDVVSIVVPEGGEAGSSRTVTWTVRNIGEIATAGSWVDRVYLSPTDGLSGAVLVAESRIDETVAPDGLYQRAATFALPDLAVGSYRVVVVSDAAASLQENGRETNNLEVATGSVGITSPDLVVEQLSAPPAIMSGEVLNVDVTVRNQGGAAISGPFATRVYLSRDGVPSFDDLVVGTVTHADGLAAGTSVFSRVSLALPLDLDGAYSLIAVTDVLGQVRERDAEANNAATKALAVTIAPYANLAVSGVTAPTRAIRDPATIEVAWTVTNSGTGIGRTTTWTDTIIASRNDTIGDFDDVVLGEVVHTGGLAVGASYSERRSVTFPPNFSDRVNVYVVADRAGNVFERGQKADNLGRAANPTDIMPQPYADLVFTAMDAAPQAESGRPLRISYTVKNDGIGLTSTAAWVDTVIVARNPDGSGIVRTQQFTRTGALAAGDSYTRTGDITLPNGISGTFYVYAVTGGPYEFIFSGNNTSPIVPRW